MTDLRTFLASAQNVHGAQHGSEFIYVGNDITPERWVAFFNERQVDLDSARSIEEAKVAAHLLFDKGECTTELRWAPVRETATLAVELEGPDFV
jgi:hypothetical protein